MSPITRKELPNASVHPPEMEGNRTADKLQSMSRTSRDEEKPSAQCSFGVRGRVVIRLLRVSSRSQHCCGRRSSRNPVEARTVLGRTSMVA